MSTTKGEVFIELADDFAPRHTQQFRAIVRQGLYSNTKFHRVIQGFMAQGGDIEAVNPDAPDIPTLDAEFTFRRDPARLSLTPRDSDQADGIVMDVGLTGFL